MAHVVILSGDTQRVIEKQVDASNPPSAISIEVAEFRPINLREVEAARNLETVKLYSAYCHFERVEGDFALYRKG